MSSPISSLVEQAYLGARQFHKQLGLWPLLAWEAPQGPPGFELLSNALAVGTLLVDEVSKGGEVPHVRVTNHGSKPVAILFGEEIVGAKQNRIANASFLIGARQQRVVDVSCVEQGRWHRRPNARFSAGEHVVSTRLRRRMASRVADSRARGGSFVADQGEVWREVGHRLSSAQTLSPSSAYTDYARSRNADLEEIGRAFRPMEGQIGFIAAIGDSVEGIEVVGHPQAFASVFPRLLRAYAIDAIDAAFLEGAARRTKQTFEAPEIFLEALEASPVEIGPSLGEGDDLRIRGDRVVGCALVAGELVHLVAFPSEG